MFIPPHTDVRAICDEVRKLRDAIKSVGLEAPSLDSAINMMTRQSIEIELWRNGELTKKKSNDNSLSDDQQIEAYMNLNHEIFSTYEYSVITDYYGNRTAKRHDIPLINHINEGLDIMINLRSDLNAMKAYCIHPLYQNPSDYGQNKYMLKMFDKDVLDLVTQYSEISNAYLCRPETDHYDINDLPLIPNKQIHDMIYADKYQNRSSFLKHHQKTHPRATQLERYFNLWLRHLKS